MSLKSLSIRVGLLLFVLAILFTSLYLIFKPDDDIKPLHFYSYSGKFEGIVEIDGRTPYNGKYFLSISDFYPVEEEFSDYLSKFQDPEVSIKYIILTNDTYIFDHRTTPGKMITLEEVKPSLFTSSDRLQFKV